MFALSSNGRLFSIPISTHEIPLTNWPWDSSLPAGIVELKPASPLGWFERLDSISAGMHHLLCLTTAGRSFAHPVTPAANDYGQLGMTQLSLTATQAEIELHPTITNDPLALTVAFMRRKKEKVDPIPVQSVSDETRSAILNNSALFEIPALRDLPVHKLVAGTRTSYALTKDNHVLGWGANDYG